MTKKFLVIKILNILEAIHNEIFSYSKTLVGHERKEVPVLIKKNR